METPLDETYFVWLYGQTGSVKLKNPARTHWALARQLYTKQFVWFIPNDDNRLEDGKELRYHFLELEGIHDPDPVWMDLECSMFEMLIALARRLSFADDQDPEFWFEQLMKNLNIDQYTDRKYMHDPTLAEKMVDEALDRVIWRTYSFDGIGGLFPLRSPMKDQREIELWEQMNAYLIENLL
jgi:hypothetical protein